VDLVRGHDLLTGRAAELEANMRATLRAAADLL